MDQDQVALVQETWRKLKPDLRVIGTKFYSRFFELDPTVVLLFPMKNKAVDQAELFMRMLDSTIEQLGNPDDIVATLLELGQHHVRYGLKIEHYPSISSALMLTVYECLGGDFTDEVREAWTEALLLITGMMKHGSDRKSGPTFWVVPKARLHRPWIRLVNLAKLTPVWRVQQPPY